MREHDDIYISVTYIEQWDTHTSPIYFVLLNTTVIMFEIQLKYFYLEYSWELQGCRDRLDIVL